VGQRAQGASDNVHMSVSPALLHSPAQGSPSLYMQTHAMRAPVTLLTRTPARNARL